MTAPREPTDQLGIGATDMTDNTQPEALQLATASNAMADEGVMIHLLSWQEIRNLLRANVAELRRLHAENERLSGLCDKWNSECDEFREDNKRLAALVEAQQPAPSAAAVPDAWKIPQPEVGGSAVPVTQDDVDAAREKVLWCLGSALLSGSDLEAQQAIEDRHMIYSLLGDANCRLVGAISPQPSPTPQADSQPAPVATNYKQALWSKNCMQCCVSYMLGLPLNSAPDFATDGGWELFSEFVDSKGYAAVMLPGNHEFEADYLASGTTARGTSHMVVMNDGKLVHDPHPSNAGLTEVQCVWLLAKKATPQRDDREAFEACAKAYTSNVSFERDGDDYEDMTASLLWHGWKLRAARAPADSVTAPAGGAVAGPALAPSAFVNAAGIKADDKPGTVVRKLDAAFHDAVTFADAAQQVDARLWCVHVQGPDDVIAMPSKSAALEHANDLNALFGRHPYEEGDPIMRAVVIEWPHSADSHAADLAIQDATHGAAPTPPAQTADSVTAPAYSIDADPQGIRARVADAITGALAFGAQGANPPPTGHWLVPFWETAREEASRNRPVSSDTLYLLRRLLSNQHTLTGSEFREELTKIVGEAAHGIKGGQHGAEGIRKLKEDIQ